MQLSKSEYLMYLRHPAWLWLKKHDKSKLPPIDEATQALFDEGFLFESYAEQLFPEGLRLDWEGYQEYLTLPERTREAILSGAKVIFQGRFEAGELTAIFDVLEFVGDKEVNLYEIKSSNSAKPDHEHDLAFQQVVLEDSGYTVSKASVIHVNKNYVRQGEVDPKQLAQITDITEAVQKRIPDTRYNIEEALKVAKSKERPPITPAICRLSGTRDWIEIYKDLERIETGDGSIYDLYSPSASLIGKLEEAGITRLADIPADFPGLSAKQRWQLKALAAGEAILDDAKIKKFLDELEYPLYFLDYETLSSVVPYFDGYAPRQQVPFQYSLHIIEHPGAEPVHKYYLHNEASDPVLPLSKQLKKDIGPTGTVVAWNIDFEKSCNVGMAKIHPELAEFYTALNERFVDLMKPFFDFYYVDAAFRGSASIKYVLPVLVPDLKYSELEIADGLTAQRNWMQAVLDGKKEGERDKILADLEKYCELDTLAMVRIWEFLKDLVGKQDVSQQKLF